MAMNPRKIGEGLYQPLAEINVTPLVDVMLVLLIIFMVTAPMLAAGIKVNLPSAKTAQPLEAKEPVIVVVAKDGAVSVGKDPVSRDELAAKVKARLGELQWRRSVARRPRRFLWRCRVGDGRSRGERRDPHRDRLRAGAAHPAPPNRRRAMTAATLDGRVFEPPPLRPPWLRPVVVAIVIALHAAALSIVLYLAPKPIEQPREVVVDIEPRRRPAEDARRRRRRRRTEPTPPAAAEQQPPPEPTPPVAEAPPPDPRLRSPRRPPEPTPPVAEAPPEPAPPVAETPPPETPPPLLPQRRRSPKRRRLNPRRRSPRRRLPKLRRLRRRRSNSSRQSLRRRRARRGPSSRQSRRPSSFGQNPRLRSASHGRRQRRRPLRSKQRGRARQQARNLPPPAPPRNPATFRRLSPRSQPALLSRGRPRARSEGGRQRRVHHRRVWRAHVVRDHSFFRGPGSRRGGAHLGPIDPFPAAARRLDPRRDELQLCSPESSVALPPRD